MFESALVRKESMQDGGDDSQLLSDVRAARRGDGDAYARIVRRFQEALVRRMSRFARGRAEVEELVQEIFVETYFALPKFREDAPFEHWLQRIATRVGYRSLKRRQARAGALLRPLALADEDGVRQTSPAPSPMEASEALESLLGGLSARDRLVITLLYVEGRSVDETAAHTGWSRTMVKVQSFRARKKLKRLIESGRGAALDGGARA